VKNVGEPCAGEPHARFDAAAGGTQASRQARAAPAPPADPTATTQWNVLLLLVSMNEEGLSTGFVVGALGPAGGLVVASGAHVSIAPCGRGD
jgi:hypothetical protein